MRNAMPDCIMFMWKIKQPHRISGNNSNWLIKFIIIWTSAHASNNFISFSLFSNCFILFFPHRIIIYSFILYFFSDCLFSCLKGLFKLIEFIFAITCTLFRDASSIDASLFLSGRTYSRISWKCGRKWYSFNEN